MLRLILRSASFEINYLSSDNLSYAQYVGWFVNMLSGNLGYVKKCIYTWLQLNECAEISHTCYLAFYYVAYSIFLSQLRLPGLLSGNFKLRAIFSPLISLIRAFTLSPTLKTFFGFSTLPQDISEM